jgi:hypothetical protein
MGYDLHITRKNYWFDDDGPIITLEEWRAYAATDPELEADLEYSRPGTYELISHPDRWPLWYRKGEIYTKNPDDAVIAKLVEIAGHLRARAVGDDDEIYGVDPKDPTVFRPSE